MASQPGLTRAAPDFLIYGVTGYTGGLIAQEAIDRGLRPTIAGRDPAALAQVAQRLDAARAARNQPALERRAFDLSDPATIDAGLRGVMAVVHCAGPFAHTSRQMADACLRCGVHYLDITGEVAVFESLAARDAEARSRGVMLLPGVGFDVVPSDCLAVRLKRRLPSATRLTLAFEQTGGMSRGTAATVVENLPGGATSRQNGKLAPSLGNRSRRIDLGRGPQVCVPISWGDVSTAFYSTGIPNIEVYLAAPRWTRWAMRISQSVSGILVLPAAQSFLQRMVRRRPAGPTPAERAKARSRLWGEVSDDRGAVARARLEGPDGYTLTADSAVAIVHRILEGQAQPGFQTPSRLFGPDFVLELAGVTCVDLE